VNADGYDELLVGAPQDLKDKGGKAYLFFGGDSIGFNQSIELIGDTTRSYNSYGRIVSGLGDINGDGFDDFGILSIDYTDIYSGKTLEVLSKINSYYEFWNVNGYDLNKDNYSDFIICYARQEDQYAGGITLYFGGNELDTVNVLTLNGNTRNSYFGNRLAIGGDINADSLPEIFIGEDGELTQSGTLGSGTVYIYSYGKPNGVKDREGFTLPLDYELFPNYPNPFNPSTTFQYKLNKVLDVQIDIYDIFGRIIKNLFDDIQQPGSYSITWNSTNEQNDKAASGVYFLSFTAKPIMDNKAIQREIIKMVLMK
ncbi:MAG: T9SS type A sorting domain-containing protein, partial [Ignavibacteriales bacterium]|nr:T9SS type A sorting domain-containing protein [Ignavibacteriales bacterium]